MRLEVKNDLNELYPNTGATGSAANTYPSKSQTNSADIPLNGGKIIVDGKEFYLYKVKKSEGFYTITNKFGVSKEEVIQYNPEAREGLRLNQIIKLPVIQGRNSNKLELEESADYLYHTVDSGQTLFFISRKYGVEEEDITSINPGTKQVLLYGTQLRIPIVKMIDKPERTDDDFLYHKIKPKETLYSISRNYGVNVKGIIASNPGIETVVLQPGDEIRIPRIQPSKMSADQTSALTVHPKASADKEEKTWEDANYFYHYVVKDENLFNITQRYHANMQDVLAANNLKPNDGIKLGYYLKIPKSSIKTEIPEQQGKENLVYKVRARRESITLISEQFGINAEEIIALNPQIEKWNRIRRGTAINIPIKVKFAKTEPMKDTALINKAKPVNVDSLLLAEAFLVGCDTLGVDQTWNVAVLWPLYLEMNDTINNIYEISDAGDTIPKIRDPKTIAYDRNGFREFYTGVLLAIDSLVNNGMRINLYTHDISKDTSDIQQLIESGDLDDMDLIIGPVYKKPVAIISNYCKEMGIRMVAPYPIAPSTLESNPFVFQVRSAQEALYKPAIDFIVKNYSNFNIIVVTGNDKTKRQEHFSALLKRELYRHRMDHFEPIYFNEINYDKYSYGGLNKLISKTNENLVIIPSENGALFNKVAPNIENLIYKKKIENITMFGFPEWQNLTDREKEILFKIHTVLYSPFYINFEQDLTLDITSRFREFASTEPRAEGMISYGLLGYDVAFYFISALKAFGTNFDSCLPYLKVDLSTAAFKFTRTNNWSGFENKNSFFIEYTRDFDIKLLDQY